MNNSKKLLAKAKKVAEKYGVDLIYLGWSWETKECRTADMVYDDIEATPANTKEWERFLKSLYYLKPPASVIKEERKTIKTLRTLIGFLWYYIYELEDNVDNLAEIYPRHEKDLFAMEQKLEELGIEWQEDV